MEQATLRRYARLYGTLARQMLGNAQSYVDLGEHFGADLYACEVEYLIDREWACYAEDILERRTKLGLVISGEDARRLEAWMVERMAVWQATAIM